MSRRPLVSLLALASRVALVATASALVVGCFTVVDLDSFRKGKGTDTILFGSAPYQDLRLTLASMRPHGGHAFEYRVIDANNFVQSRGVVKGLSPGDTTMNVPRAVPKQNGPYRLDFYADVNRSGGFDGLGSVISNDHAWRIEPLVDYPEGSVAPVDGLIQVTFLHNTSFTNIDQYPSGTPNPPLDTTLPVQLRFEGLAAAQGRLFEARVADKGTGHVACLYRIEKVDQPTVDAVVPGCVDVDTEYQVDVYIDANDDHKYDDPSVGGGDLGFRFAVTSSASGVRETFDVSDGTRGKINVGAP